LPTTAPDIVITTAGTAVTFDVRANDSGSSLVIDSFTQPAAGSLVLNPDQTFTYTSDAAFSGVDQFTYTVRDADGATAAGTVTITVLASNSPPGGEDDEAVTVAGEITIDVLANDSDPDGDMLHITALGTPAYGSVTINPDQSLTYWPQQGFFGTDRFSYTIDDGRGGSATATVTIRVERGNLPPTAGTLELSTTVDTPLVFDPRSAATDPDGDSLRIEGLGMPGSGRLALNGDGSLTYTPDPGFSGEDRFTYTLGDGRGGSATGTIVIRVERPNTVPVAVADPVGTAFDTPVTIDVLANDSDPDGDPLQLESLGFPAHGRLAVNGDGSLTYTPDPGFSGEDVFTYTITDARGGRASGEVRITVAPPPPQTYANGYGHRRRLLIPPRESAESVTDFVLRVEEQGDWLKSLANGGNIESDQGFDLRFELEDGTKLDHEIDSYDPVAGKLLAWVRIPSWDQAQSLHLFLYHGKSGLTVSEENPTGVWQGYLAVWDTQSGRDRSGNGRDLTLAGVTGSELVGASGRFDGNADERLGDGMFLSGLGALYIQAVVQADPAILGNRDAYVVRQGDPAASVGDVGIGLLYDSSGYFGGASRTVKFALATSDGSVQIEGPSGIQSSERQVLAAAWQAGTLPKLYVDGEEVVASWAGLAGQQGTVANGATSMVAGQPLSIGLGALNTAKSWIGLIDEVRISASIPAAGRIAAEAHNLLDPSAFYGIGDGERFTDGGESPVAAPLSVSTTPGQWVEIDPLAVSYLPTGTSLALGQQPQNGIVTLVGDKLHYTPFAGFTGSDSFTYTLGNGTKSAEARVDVAVAIDSLSGEYPAPLRIIRVSTRAELDNALAAVQPGDHIVLADGSYGNSRLVIDAQGTQMHPVVVRSVNPLGAHLPGGFDFTAGSRDVMLWGLDLKDAESRLRGTRNIVRRCRIWPPFKADAASTGIHCRKGTDCRIDYCEIRLYTTAEVGGGSPWNSTIYSGIWGNYWGSSFADGDVMKNLVIERCLFTGGPSGVAYSKPNAQFVEAMGDYAKTSRPENWLYWTIRLCYGTVPRDRTLFDFKAGKMILDRVHMTAPGDVQLRDGCCHEILGCRFDGSGMIIANRYDHKIWNTLANTIRLLSGDQDYNQNIGPKYHAACRNVHLANCTGSLKIGHQYNVNTYTYPADLTLVENHSGSIAYGNHRNTTVRPTSSVPVRTPITLTAAEVGPHAPWVGVIQ